MLPSPIRLILTRKVEISDLIATARLEEALKLLIDLVHNVDEGKKHVVILISMEYYDLKDDHFLVRFPEMTSEFQKIGLRKTY